MDADDAQPNSKNDLLKKDQLYLVEEDTFEFCQI